MSVPVNTNNSSVIERHTKETSFENGLNVNGGRVRVDRSGNILPLQIQDNIGFNSAGEHYGSSRARWSVRRARGTVTAPTAPLDNDVLGSYQGWGWDPALEQFALGGEMDFVADANFSGTDFGTRVRMRLVPPGATALVDMYEFSEVANDDTAFLVRIKKGAAAAVLERVTLGAVDSGGVGLRALVVTN